MKKSRRLQVAPFTGIKRQMKRIFKNKKDLIAVILIAGLILIGSACLCAWEIIRYNKYSKLQIDNIAITHNGKEAKSLYAEFTAESLDLGVEINGKDVDDLKRKRIDVEWTIISEDGLGCEIDADGLIKIGNKLGNMTVQVKVMSKNVAAASAEINIFAPESATLRDIEVKAPQDGLVFIEGQKFDSTGIDVFAHFADIEKTPLISDLIYSEEPLSVQDTEIEIKASHAGVSTFAVIPIVVKPKTLQSIEITKVPNKRHYIEGQSLDLSGIEVMAHYEYIDKIVDDYYVGLDGALTADDSEINVFYTNGPVTKEAKVNINVEPRTLEAIEIVTPPNKVKYIQGQLFNAKGIKVLARYEYMTVDVSDLIEWDKKGRLLTDDKSVTISYEEKGVKLSKSLDIDVDLPYSSTRKIIMENPFDASLTWIFSYSEDGVTDKIDNTLLDGHSNLLYDAENGVYIVPVGALVTIRKISPAVTDFILNGEELNLNYPSSTAEFEVGFGENDLEVSFKKILGDRITVRLSEGYVGANWAFIYPLSHNGVLRAKDLDQIAAIYEDGDNYYFEYRIDGQAYTFPELCNFTFRSDTFINVKRVERILIDSVKLFVRYPNGNNFDYTVSRNDEFAFDKLPKIEKHGYALSFSLTEDGAAIGAKDFKEWLLRAEDGSVVFAVYSLNAETVTGDILGRWSYAHSTGGHSFELNLEFNANGTYSYSLLFDSKLNCTFEGVFGYKNGTVTILSLEYKGEYQLISVNDFTVEIDNGKLKTKLFVIDGISVMTGEINLTKAV